MDELAGYQGRVAELGAAGLATLMGRSAELEDLLGRAGNYVMLRFSENTSDPERGAAMMAFEERLPGDVDQAGLLRAGVGGTRRGARGAAP
ncbi:MAG: hypothetical protein R2716_11080 [Microthrixaceae bacterium]